MISGIFHFDELSQTSSPGHHVTCARSATFNNNFWEACAIFHVCLRCHFFNQFPFLVRARLVQVSKVYDSLALSGNDISAFLTLLHNSFMWQLRIEIRIYVLDAWILSVMHATLTDKVSSVHFADIFGFWLRNQNILSIWLSCVIAARQSVAFVVVSFISLHSFSQRDKRLLRLP